MSDYRVNLHDPLSAALADLEKAGERGARRAIRQGSTMIVRDARRRFLGRPRWDRRGKGRTGPAVNLNLNPAHVELEGGPGKLTGDLRRGIHALRPRVSAGGVDGKVSAMGGPRNLYAGRVEKQYPFLEPAARAFDTVAPAVFESAWAEEIGKVK